MLRADAFRTAGGFHPRLWLGGEEELLAVRRPAGPALRRTLYLARTVPRDTVSLRAFAQAAAAWPWVLRERRVLPAQVEARTRVLEEAQRRSSARRYVG